MIIIILRVFAILLGCGIFGWVLLYMDFTWNRFGCAVHRTQQFRPKRVHNLPVSSAFERGTHLNKPYLSFERGRRVGGIGCKRKRRACARADRINLCTHTYSNESRCASRFIARAATRYAYVCSMSCVKWMGVCAIVSCECKTTNYRVRKSAMRTTGTVRVRLPPHFDVFVCECVCVLWSQRAVPQVRSCKCLQSWMHFQLTT